jgi:hypothetical protein
MNQTVAVAIVTGIAALGGAGLTAWINLRNSRLQAEHQLTVAREERSERRTAAHRTARRDAYTGFLTAALTAVQKITQAEGRGLTDDEYQTRWMAAQTAVNQTLQAHAVLSIEGPEKVARASQQLRAILFSELRTLRAVRRGDKPASALAEASKQRKSAVDSLTATAREALGGDISTT